MISQPTPSRVAIIDSIIDGVEALEIAATEAGLHTHLLKPGEGFAEAAQAIAEREQVEALHIVSHGTAGQLTLGNDVLNSETLNHASIAMAQIRGVLSKGADIFLYGCCAAAGKTGQEFVQKLADLTDATVSASSTLIGAAEKGGNWVLDVVCGSPKAQPISAPAFAGTLVQETLAFNSDVIGWDSDSIAEDNEGGSVDIPGLTIQIYSTSDASATKVNSIDWFDDQSLGTTDGFSGVNVDYDTFFSTVYGMVIKSSDGSEFDFGGFDFFNAFEQFGEGMTVVAYRDGSVVAGSSVSFTSNIDNNSVNIDLSANTFYENVDEIRISYDDGSGYLSINNIVIDTGNALPTVSGAPSDVTVTEDILSNLDLSNATFAEADGDDLTVTLAVNAGTLAASSGGGVTVGGTATARTLAGTATAINTFLDTASNIQYTSASNASGDNAALLTIIANDGAGSGNVNLGTVNINITAVDDAPVINSNGGGASSALNIDENTTAVTTVAATDPDVGDTVTYSITGGADETRFSIDTNSGALTFVSAPDFENATDANTDNVYEVEVTATDDSIGTLTDVQTLSVTVDNVNEAPTLTAFSAPVDSGNTNQEVEITFAELAAQGDETDDTAVTAFVINAVTSGTLKIGADAGSATDWAPMTNDIVDTNNRAFWTPATDATGTLGAFTVTAKDAGGLTSSAPVQAEVNIQTPYTPPPVNFVPVFTSYEQQSEVNLTYELSQDSLTVATLTVEDRDDSASALQYSLSGSDASLFRFDAESRTLAFRRDPESNGNASYDVTVKVTDSDDDFDTQRFLIEVTGAPENQPPVISNLDRDSLIYTEGDGTVIIDQGSPATLSDVDSAFFDGGTLTVQIAYLEPTEYDTISLDTSGEVALSGTLAGSSVSVGGITVGTLDQNIEAFGPLFINLNANANAARVQELIQAATYEYTGETSWDRRDIEFFLTNSDGSAWSSAYVSLTVEEANEYPTLTEFSGPVESTNTNQEVEISFEELADKGNESDDEAVTAFVVTAVTSGTLKIGTSAETAEEWIEGIEDTIDEDSNAYWTPAADATGTVGAFTVIARDDGALRSTGAIQAEVQMTTAVVKGSMTLEVPDDEAQRFVADESFKRGVLSTVTGELGLPLEGVGVTLTLDGENGSGSQQITNSNTVVTTSGSPTDGSPNTSFMSGNLGGSPAGGLGRAPGGGGSAGGLGAGQGEGQSLQEEWAGPPPPDEGDQPPPPMSASTIEGTPITANVVAESYTVVQADYIDIITVEGEAKLFGGGDDSLVMADSADQWLMQFEGDDFLFAGGGDDTVGSMGGDDYVDGESGDDTVFGGAGNDTLRGATGDNILNGGFGFDEALFDDERSAYSFTLNDSNQWNVTHTATGDVTTLIDVEVVTFADQSLFIAQSEVEAVGQFLLNTWMDTDLTASQVTALQSATWQSQTAEDVVDIFLATIAPAELQGMTAEELLVGFDSDTAILKAYQNRVFEGGSGNDQGYLNWGIAKEVDGGEGFDVLKIAGDLEDFYFESVGNTLEVTSATDGAMISLTNAEALVFDSGDTIVFAQSADETLVARLFEIMLDRGASVSEWELGSSLLDEGDIHNQTILNWFQEQSGLEGGDAETGIQQLYQNAFERYATDEELAAALELVENHDLGYAYAAVNMAVTEEADSSIGNIISYYDWV